MAIPDEVILSREIWRSATMRLPYSASARMVDRNVQVMADQFGYAISADYKLVTVTAKHATKSVACAVPADWWESFKERWLPFLGFKTRTIWTNIDIKYLCPHHDIKWPSEEHFDLVDPIMPDGDKGG